MGNEQATEFAIQATEKKVLRHIAEKRMVDVVRIVGIRDELKPEGVRGAWEDEKESGEMEKRFG